MNHFETNLVKVCLKFRFLLYFWKKLNEKHIVNIISVIIGFIALILALVGLIPALGWINWIALPVAVTGAIFGLFASRKSGRNMCLIIIVLSMFRLFMGGGIL